VRSRVWVVLTLVLSVPLSFPARGQFAPYAGQHDLLPLYPARPAFGSGTVFRINRSVDGSRYTRVLCRNLFAGITPERVPYPVKGATYTDPDRFDEATGILYGVLTSARQTAETLQAQRTKLLKLSYKDTMLEQLPSRVRLNLGASASSLDAGCLDVLAKLKAEGDSEPLYLVDRALVVNGFRVEIERPPEFTSDATEVLDVNVDYASQSQGKNAVEIQAPYYIGMNVLAIVDIEPALPGADPRTRVVKTGPAKLPERYRSWE